MRHPAEQTVLTRAQQLLLRRARLLPDRDAALIQNFIERRMPASQTARILGLHPGSLQRRIRQLINRLTDPSVGLLLDHGDFLPPELRQLGLERRLHGMTIRQLADLHRLSPYQIRSMLTELQGCLRARAAATLTPRR